MKQRRLAVLLLSLILTLRLMPLSGVAAETPGFSGTLSGQNVDLKAGTVTVSLTGMDGSAAVLGAFYGEDGHLVGVGMEPVGKDAAQVTLDAQLSGTAVGVRVFLLDESALTPVCPAQEWERSDAILPLEIVRSLTAIQGVDDVEPFGEHWHLSKDSILTDLSADPALTYSLTISDKTTFAGLPRGYDPKALLEWGKDPGLNVDILHKHGFTGEGAVLAYVDQPIGEHGQYSGQNLHYVNNTTSNNSMHGPAVLSLLAGKDIGTAPDAQVYFYAHASWERDQTTHAECLYQIIEQNKSLPEGEKITMVGFSDNIDQSEANAAALEEAVQACQDAGIMVWFCGEYAGMSFLPLSDKNDFRSLVPESWGGANPKLVCVPSSGRTSAATYGEAEYIYWSSGGLSWTMPYVLGLYGIAVEIDPTLTQEQLRTLIVDTAYVSGSRKIINPVGFVAQVLRNVGRGDEAQAMLDEVEARTRFLYAVMDTAAMSEDDLTAVGSYLASITDATVLVADAAGFSSAQELYTALQEDARTRNGHVAGVQIFGTAEMVPAFQVKYKVQMPSGVDEGGMFLSDLFYSNFDNHPQQISNGYNVLDHFAQGWDVDLVPDWPVARLPLEKGEYTAFFRKYQDFVTDTGLDRLDLVNFSNPIFASNRHIDDMGVFLGRMDSEFGLLDVPCRLYGNLEGQYPVSTTVLGGFTAENLTAENEAGMAEFLINSHGQWNNIDKCYFVDGEEVRESLVNIDTINTVFPQNPYYLDCWTCLNGYGMGNNLTTAALNGNCVGMFSATTVLSNNGVNCRASLEDMAQSNFYYFYYNYLKALHEGAGRGRAFFTAQRAYAQALLADSVNGIGTGEGNYQFNLYNLLGYHNFGVLEPNSACFYFDASGYITQAGQSVPKDEVQQGGQGGQGGSQTRPTITLTDGTPVGEAKTVEWTQTGQLQTGSLTVHGSTVQELDNGYLRFTVDCTARAGMPFSVFNPPNGDIFMLYGPETSGERETLVYDLKKEDVQAVSGITMRFNFDDNDRMFLFIRTENLL